MDQKPPSPKALAVTAMAEPGCVRLAMSVAAGEADLGRRPGGDVATVSAALSLDQASDLIEGLIHAFARARALGPDADADGDTATPASGVRAR